MTKDNINDSLKSNRIELKRSFRSMICNQITLFVRVLIIGLILGMCVYSTFVVRGIYSEMTNIYKYMDNKLVVLHLPSSGSEYGVPENYTDEMISDMKEIELVRTIARMKSLFESGYSFDKELEKARLILGNTPNNGIFVDINNPSLSQISLIGVRNIDHLVSDFVNRHVFYQHLLSNFIKIRKRVDSYYKISELLRSRYFTEAYREADRINLQQGGDLDLVLWKEELKNYLFVSEVIERVYHVVVLGQ